MSKIHKFLYCILLIVLASLMTIISCAALMSVQKSKLNQLVRNINESSIEVNKLEAEQSTAIDELIESIDEINSSSKSSSKRQAVSNTDTIAISDISKIAKINTALSDNTTLRTVGKISSQVEDINKRADKINNINKSCTEQIADAKKRFKSKIEKDDRYTYDAKEAPKIDE